MQGSYNRQIETRWHKRERSGAHVTPLDLYLLVDTKALRERLKRFFATFLFTASSRYGPQLEFHSNPNLSRTLRHLWSCCMAIRTNLPLAVPRHNSLYYPARCSAAHILLLCPRSTQE